MQDTDDFDVLADLAIEDYMPSQMISAVSWTDIITGTASVRLARQEMKGLIQSEKIPVPLLTAPCLLGVVANV